MDSDVQPKVLPDWFVNVWALESFRLRRYDAPCPGMQLYCVVCGCRMDDISQPTKDPKHATTWMDNWIELARQKRKRHASTCEAWQEAQSRGVQPSQPCISRWPP